MTSKQLDGSRSTYQGHFSSPATFADNAPCLRKFRAAEFAFNLQASWLRGLRDLCISHYPPLSVTLDALATIECLEYLRLSAISFTEDDEAEDDEDLRTVHLSKLKELHLGSFHPSNCDVLLDHLIIPQDCALQYSLGLSSDWLYEDGFGTELTDLICRLSKCAQGYFLHHIPTKVWFCYEYELIGITTQAQDKSRGFHFEIKSRYLDRLEKIKAIFLAEFTLPEFNNVTELGLKTKSIENDEDVSILPFLACFTSVKVLTSNCWYPSFLQSLKKMLDPPRSVLRLQTQSVQVVDSRIVKDVRGEPDDDSGFVSEVERLWITS